MSKTNPENSEKDQLKRTVLPKRLINTVCSCFLLFHTVPHHRPDSRSLALSTRVTGHGNHQLA